MNIVQIVEPQYEPLTLEQAKEWLRIDGSEEDALLLSLIEAARVHAENFTRRAFITQQFEFSLDAFPCGQEIVLPRPPLVSVQSVKYYDTAGVLQTFSTGSYHVDTRSQPGRVVLVDGSYWLDAACRPNSVVVAYTAGYGTPADVPKTLQTAMRYLVSHWFENRAHINIGNIVNPIDDTAAVLLWQHRIPGFY